MSDLSRHRFLLVFVGLLWIPLAGSAQVAADLPKPPGLPQGLSLDEAMGQRAGVAVLEKRAEDAGYGFTEKSAVRVGGGFKEGSGRIYRFLNALLGPAGETVHYKRIGSCCSFKTSKSPSDGTGLLEIYEIHYEGGKPVRLYFNWYEEGDLLIPKGLTARKE